MHYALYAKSHFGEDLICWKENVHSIIIIIIRKMKGIFFIIYHQVIYPKQEYEIVLMYIIRTRNKEESKSYAKLLMDLQ